jgi:transcriptional regulator with XRE-family HTH domain
MAKKAAGKNRTDTYARGSGVPNPVDVHVGNRLRQKRALMGMSQEKLAESIDLTFQQIQKYERGANRISASRLYQLSKILNVPISYFFEKFGEEGNEYGLKYSLSDNKQEEIINEDMLHNKETIELIRTYYSITDPKVRKDILGIVKTMAQNMNTSN